MDIRDSRAAPLAGILVMPNFKLLHYSYDFGDDWRHTIKVERRFSAELWEDYPRLVDAKGRCPPEDVGGPWGYAKYLDAMSDPTHTRHAVLIDWLGRRDPSMIDRQAMATALARVAGSVGAPAKKPPRKRGHWWWRQGDAADAGNEAVTDLDDTKATLASFHRVG